MPEIFNCVLKDITSLYPFNFDEFNRKILALNKVIINYALLIRGASELGTPPPFFFLVPSLCFRVQPGNIMSDLVLLVKFVVSFVIH